MRATDLERLYDYHYWANKRLFAVLSRLTADEFTRSVAGSYGSIRNTLVHTMSAEWGWLDRCGGERRGPKLEGKNYPTAESLIAQWERVEEFMRGFLSGLTAEDLNRPINCSFDPAKERPVPLGHVLQHGITHAAHHRGQVALLLRMLGRTPGNFDLVLYDSRDR